MDNILEYIRCPFCKTESFSVLHQVPDKDGWTPGLLQIVKCKSCDLIYLNPRVKENSINKYYPSLYYQTKESNPEKILKSPYEKEKLAVIKKFKILENREKSILDIGCNKGEFLENLKRLGYKNLKGIELDGDCVKFARDNFKIDLLKGKIEDFPEDEKFDIITLWHSLEHFYNIDSAIDKIKNVLKKDGTVIISTPNIKSFQANIMGKYWYHIDAPRHTVSFDKTTLKKFLERHGLYIIESTNQYPSHNLDGWYNSLLIVWNSFKYRQFQEQSTSIKRGANKERLPAIKILLLQTLKNIMYLFSYIEMALGSGAAITIVAKMLNDNRKI